MLLSIARAFPSAVLFFAALAGLWVGDWISPLPIGMYDWDWSLSWEFSQAIRRYDTFVLGFWATFPVVLLGRYIDAAFPSQILVPVTVGFVYYLASNLRDGMFDFDIVLVNAAIPMFFYLAGLFCAFGLIFVVLKLWSFRSGEGNI